MNADLRIHMNSYFMPRRRGNAFKTYEIRRFNRYEMAGTAH